MTTPLRILATPTAAPQPVPDSVTVCITTCERLDLLKTTLDSFRQFHSGAKIVISDDSGDPLTVARIKADYPEATVLSGPKQIGLMRSIDRLYGSVETPYIFHLDDDWLFDRPIDWSAAIELLESRDDVANVAMRVFTEIKPKYRPRAAILTVGGVSFALMHRDAHPEFFGWSHSPGLMRAELYRAYAPFGRLRHDEMSGVIKRDGRREAHMLPGVAHHIGLKRTVTDPTVPARPTTTFAKWVRWLKKRLYYAGLRKAPF